MSTDKLFAVHLLNESGIEKAKELASRFQELWEFIHRSATSGLSGRELSIVATKLEEATFFAKKAMALDPANQKNP